MPNRTARLFHNGGSQAVRLPAEFRFEGDEVFVRRDEHSGDVILSKKKPKWSTWAEYLVHRNAASVPEEFMTERPLNTPLRERSVFDENA